jgi:uncharacterized protein (DUF433 family)
MSTKTESPPFASGLSNPFDDLLMSEPVAAQHARGSDGDGALRRTSRFNITKAETSCLRSAVGGRILRGSHENPMTVERRKRITVEEGKCGGRPCIRGQRIRVTDILELLASGAGYNEILADYPFLEQEDIYAAIEYAAHQADHTVLEAL